MASQNGDVSADLVVAISMFALRPAASVQAMAAAIRDAKFVDFPNSHLAALESPALMGPMLISFFNDQGL